MYTCIASQHDSFKNNFDRILILLNNKNIDNRCLKGKY